MDETIRERLPVYEIGYLIAGVPQERMSVEADAIKKLVADAGAVTIAEEAPRSERLAYVMRKKTVAGSYDSYDTADFGWIKFEVGSDKIEALKMAVEAVPSVLRMLLITTVRENTYLGKRVPAAASFMAKPPAGPSEHSWRSNLPPEIALAAEPADKAPKKETAPVAPASVEEMDKSIDEMVKEA
jgi:ribosomal protein S6